MSPDSVPSNDTTEQQRKHHPRAAFQSRNFRLFQTARFLFVVGWQMQSVAIAWQVAEATGRPLDVGFVGLIQFLPAIGLFLITGHVADRHDRRRIVMACMAGLGLASVLLAVLTVSGQVRLSYILALTFLIGVCHAFATPASQALMPQLVPPEHFPNAVAWNSSIWQVAAITGPALGGLLIHFGGGPQVVYFTDALICTVAALLVARIHARSVAAEQNSTPTLETLFAGIRYVWEKKVILGAITLDLFAVLLGGAVALLPFYAKDILHVGSLGYGLLRAAPSIGAAAMAVIVAHLPPFQRAGRLMLIAVALFGVLTIVFGLSRSFGLSLAALVAIGAADMISVVIRHTLVQIVTPHEMRGRVSAVNSVFIGASNQLGEFESGVTAQWFGLVPSVVIGGLGTLLVVAVIAVLFPELRKFGRLDRMKT
ncbi:MAG: MFS transporter [Candidatus Hydrogenedentota bacterium]|nr:MAG: MFS transporter [Candidatus Hydrogenedentota bacterium]